MSFAKYKIISAFFCLSFLTCGFPIFIMQAVSYYHISHSSAGGLEAYFNLTRVSATFIIFTLFLRFGYNKPIGLAFLSVAVIALLQPMIDSIWMLRLYLLLVGASYVAINVGCYSMVGLVTKNRDEHAGFINLMEGLHMFASMIGMWLFSFFSEGAGRHWLYTFWIIAAACLIMAALFLLHSIGEKQVDLVEHKPIFQELRKLPPYVFTIRVLLAIFLLICYEIIEQGMGPWLHNFNNEVLQLPKFISIQIGSLFVMSIAIGRIIGGLLFKKYKYYKVLTINFIIGFILIGFAISNMHIGMGKDATSIFNAPLIAFLLPLLGLFIGPVYPTITSTLLSKIPVYDHSIIMSMLMIVVAISDSGAARIVGSLFEHYGGITAIGISVLLPLAMLLVFIIPYGRLNNRNENISNALSK